MKPRSSVFRGSLRDMSSQLFLSLPLTFAEAADLFADTLLGMVWLPLDKEACAALRAVTLPCCDFVFSLASSRQLLSSFVGACCSCAAEEFVLVRPEAAPHVHELTRHSVICGHRMPLSTQCRTCALPPGVANAVSWTSWLASLEQLPKSSERIG